MPSGATTITFVAPLRIWMTDTHGGMGWLRIEGEPLDTIRAHELERRLERGRRRGFGSVRVNVTVGASRWSTSIFPQDDGFFLPVKKAICRAERLEEGDAVAVTLELL